MNFYHPEPPRLPRRRIHPVFIPFAGCPQRCVFCAQDLQSGQTMQNASLQSGQGAAQAAPRLESWQKTNQTEQILEGGHEAIQTVQILESALSQLKSLPPASSTNQDGCPANNADSPKIVPAPELAFYGGTFTALPLAAQEALLAEAGRLKQQGRVSRVRCSTRPDAITPAILQHLRSCGSGSFRVLDDIELGVQSFCREPLEASGRGYSGETAIGACRLVRESGFGLGIQLMPGMPGMTAAHFRQDVEICAELAPDTARLYPCLVLAGTGLAELWRTGRYRPWTLEEVLDRLPPALLTLWERGIRIIRLGLAPQPELAGAILAGPAHPALGQRLRSLALFGFLSGKLKPMHKTDFSLYIPKRFQGELFGHGGELKQRYATLGLTPDRLSWWDNDYFSLHNFSACSL